MGLTKHHFSSVFGHSRAQPRQSGASGEARGTSSTEKKPAPALGIAAPRRPSSSGPRIAQVLRRISFAAKPDPIEQLDSASTSQLGDCEPPPAYKPARKRSQLFERFSKKAPSSLEPTVPERLTVVFAGPFEASPLESSITPALTFTPPAHVPSRLSVQSPLVDQGLLPQPDPIGVLLSGDRETDDMSRPDPVEAPSRTANTSPDVTPGEQGHLNLLVLLPGSAYMPHHHVPFGTGQASRPPPLRSRQSGSTVSTIRSLKQSSGSSSGLSAAAGPSGSGLAPSGTIKAQAGEQRGADGDDDDMNVVLNTRRLSLAPGIGTGTLTPTGAATAATSSSAALEPIQASPLTSDVNPGTIGRLPAPASTLRPAASTGGPPPSEASSSSTAGATAAAAAGPSAPPAFGSKRPPASPARSRRRPQTAMTTSAAFSAGGAASATAALARETAAGLGNVPDDPTHSHGSGPRGSGSGMGLGIGAGLGGASHRARPGWEGDEVVSMLRGSGLEVTVIRHASHLPAVLSPTSRAAPSAFPSLVGTSLSIGGSSTSPQSSTRVILVPLCDSPTLPSLSLLLAQGTTPTAVCFQQDLLDRARRTEEEWLPSALDQIRHVVDMRDRAVHELELQNPFQTQSLHAQAPGLAPAPIILAYSANPALSQQTVAACIGAGAKGVLKPPYDLQTAKLVRRMVRAAKEGRISSAVGIPLSALPPNGAAEPGQASPALGSGARGEDTGARVVLPPTALDMNGGQLEGEKVLSSALAATAANRSRYPGSNSDSKTASPLGGRSRQQSVSAGGPIGAGVIPGSRRGSRQENASTGLNAAVQKPNGGSGADDLPEEPVWSSSSNAANNEPPAWGVSMCMYNPNYQARRRSVDVGGLTVAMRRAQNAFETASSQGTPATGVKKGFTFPGATPQEPSRAAAGQGEAEADASPTQLAELLGAMYYQTSLAIDVHMEEYNRLSAPLTPEDRRRLVGALSTWDFKPHHLDEGDLFRVAWLVFEAATAIEGVAELGIERDQMNRLLFAIRAIYHAPNPYHNYVHAIDVLQATYTFLLNMGVVPDWSFIRDAPPTCRVWKRPSEAERPACGLGTQRAREVLRPQDVFAVLIAAMGHDVGHPGLSNAFMKNAKTPLSQVYDDKSVLENMHCMLVVQLLRKHGFGFVLGPCVPDSDAGNAARRAFDARGFRKVLYSSVLATDMSLHFAWIARLKEFGDTIDAGEYTLSERRGSADLVEEDRIMICQSLIKCADISNPTRPIDVSEHWSSVLLKEWALQASLEQALALPVSVIASADAALQAKGQIGFIDLFTQPLFEAVSDVIPELHVYADTCAENRSKWQGRLDHFSDLAAAAAAAAADAAAEAEQAEQVAGSRASGVPLVQPAIDPADEQDGRFTTLFPLSLPTCLVPVTQLAPGPSCTAAASQVPAPAPAPAVSKTSAPTASTESPATQAMRAVYHASLLDQRVRHGSWSRSARMIPGVGVNLAEARRSSLPEAHSSLAA